MIVMTKAQANQVRMLTAPGHAFAPMLIKVGANVLIAGKLCAPEACITDPYNASISALLATFPTVADSAIAQTAWETDPALVIPHTYNSSWQVGQVVVVP